MSETKGGGARADREIGTRAVVYTRVSRDDTGKGASNARQREDCEKLADLRGWQVVEVCEDISISAYSGKRRPGWERVLELTRSGQVECVVAWHIDRMTRSMVELERLIVLSESHGVGIATVTGDIDLTTDVGRMVARILAAVARAEVERKGARQRRANLQRASEGIPWRSGWRAFGYEIDGTIVPSEAELVRDSAERVLNGESLRSIARHWQELGVSTPRNDLGAHGWTPRGVKLVLLNPRTCGLMRYKGEVIGRGAWEAIITEETHTLLVAKLTDPARLLRNESNGRAPQNLLTGLARCAVCGGTVDAGSGYKGAAIYQCKSYHVSTPRGAADELVRTAIAATVALVRPGMIVPIPARGVPADLDAETRRLNDRLDSLAKSFAREAITIEQLEAASASIREQQAELERTIEQGQRADRNPYALRAETVHQFLDGDLEAQRGILADFTKITLYPRGRGKRGVPMKHQLSVYVRDGDRTFAAIDEVPAAVKAKATGGTK